LISSLSHNLTAKKRVGPGACPYLLNVSQYRLLSNDSSIFLSQFCRGAPACAPEARADTQVRPYVRFELFVGCVLRTI